MANSDSRRAVVLETTMGVLTLELYWSHAPKVGLTSPPEQRNRSRKELTIPPHLRARSTTSSSSSFSLTLIITLFYWECIWHDVDNMMKKNKIKNRG